MAIAPVRYPSGVQNVQYPGTGGNATFTGASNYHPLFKYPELDPVRLTHNYDCFENGFDKVAKWTLTEGGTGSQVLSTTLPGGVLVLTTGGTTGNTEEIQMQAPCQTTVTGNQLWFSTRFRASDVSASVIVMGIQNINTTPESPTEGFYFIKPTGAAHVNFTTISTAGGTVTATSIVDLVNATDIVLSFYFDGTSGAEDDNTVVNVKYYINKVYAGYVTLTGLPVAMMAPVAYIKTSANAAKTLSVDYIWANGELTR